MIRENLSNRRLKHIVRLVNDDATSELPYVGLENVESWTGRFDLVDVEDPTGRTFRPGDVMFGKLRPYLAKAFTAQSSGRCSSEFLVLRPNPEVVSDYLKYVVLDQEFVKLVDSSTFGAKMPRANWDFIGDLRVSVPTLPTQKAIADYLDRKTAVIDALNEKKRRLLALLAEERAALINQAVTKGLDPSVPMKDSGIPWIGEVPAHWEVKQLKFTCVLQRGFDLPSQDRCNGQVPVYGGGGVTGYHDTALVQPLGVVTGRYGTIGHVYLVDVPFWPLNTSLYVKEFWGNRPDYIRYLLSSVPMKMYSAKSAVPGVDRNDVHIIRVPIPTIVEQADIVAWLDTSLSAVNRTSQQIEKQIDRLQEYRQALITAAVTGQLEIDAPP